MTRRRSRSRIYRRSGPYRSGLKAVVVLAVFAILLISWLVDQELPWGGGPPVDPTRSNLTYEVRRVVDGDTLLLTNGERIRLIGVDTPETVAPGQPVEWLGPEASLYTSRFVEGRPIRLGFDKERVDRYGRILAYVYVDEALLNEQLIREGLGTAQLKYPYSSAMKRLFREAEDEAKIKRKGLWASPSVSDRRRRAS